MELRVLRYFIEVAREQNITAAAEKLYVTQSTLSKQLMDLEKELGKKLLVRGKRKTTLTEDGMFLFRRAQEIVDLADKTEFSLKGTNEAITGDISIGCGETEGIQIIIDAMKQLNEQHPDIRFHLYSGNDEDVSERLDNGLVDFGLFVGNTNLDKYDYLKLPINDVWGLLMRKDCPLAAASTVNPTDLTGIPLLCSRQALHPNELSGWLGYDLSRHHIISTHNLINNAAFMVKAGMGCALTIDKLVSPFDPVLTFRPLEPTMKADLIFAWKKYQIFSKAASKLLEILTQKIKRS